MILASKERDAHLSSSWVTGICLAVLAVGVHGAIQPLQPPVESTVAIDTGDSVMLEDFTPPPASAPETEQEQELDETPEVEIPPVPELQTPLTPPEMTEITPVEEVRQTPPPPKPAPAKPKPVSAVRHHIQPPGHKGKGSGNSGGSGAPTLFTGGGGGRFPHPSYPAAARSARQQGVVRLLVTVEPSGLPSSVSVSSSSGFSILDQAACDHISRRWRWPSGAVRRFIVPMRFILQ